MNRLRTCFVIAAILCGLSAGNLFTSNSEAHDTGTNPTVFDSELGGAQERSPARPLAGLPPECAGAPNPWRFMFAGDSQTTGTGNQRPYWSWLWDRMATVPKVSVGSQTSPWGTHEGIGGQRPSGLLARWNGLLNNYHPDVIFLNIGTNQDWVGSYPDGPTTLNNVQALVQQALDFNRCTRIILVKTSPRYDQFESIAQQWFNDRVPSLAESFDTTGTQVRWVDFSFLPKSDTIDGLHPTATGADKESWYAWDQVQHLVGWGAPGSPGDAHLPYSAGPFPVMSTVTGTVIKR